VSKKLYVQIQYQILESRPDNFDQLFLTPLTVDGHNVTDVAGIYYDSTESGAPGIYGDAWLYHPDNGYDYSIKSIAGITDIQPIDYAEKIQINQDSSRNKWATIYVDDSYIIPFNQRIDVIPAPTLENINNQSANLQGVWSFDLRGATSGSLSSLTQSAVEKGITEAAKAFLSNLVPTYADSLYRVGSAASTLNDIQEAGLNTFADLISNFDNYSSADVDRITSQLLFDDLRKLASELETQVDANGIPIPSEQLDILTAAFTGISISAKNLTPGSPNSGWQIEIAPQGYIDVPVEINSNGSWNLPDDPIVKGDTVKIDGLGDGVLIGNDDPNARDILVGGDGRDELKGLRGNDILVGGHDNDILSGNWGNDQLNGGDGVDTAMYAFNRATYTLTRNSDGSVDIVDSDIVINSHKNIDGHDTLTNIERLQFSDQSIALDLDGHAGTVAKILGAVFGKEAVANAQYAGIFLKLLDDGMSYQDLMQLALDTKLGTGFSNAAEVNLLYQNLVGSQPSQADLDYWTGTLASGQYSQASLGVMAADLELNATNINLADLAKTGLNFTSIPIENATIIGTADPDILVGGAGNEIIAGLSGVDTALYSNVRAQYTISLNNLYDTVKDNAGHAGEDKLIDIERLQFSDQSLALDLDGHAGTVAKILGAVFGKEAVANAEYAGIGLKLLDDGMSYENLMQLALDAKLGNGFSNAAEVSLLYQNLVGSQPSQADLDYWTGTLAAGQYSQASLGIMAADLELNAANIDLIGLASTGLEYL
jgi:Ca2+-binding RTX toxin-like protein